MDKNPDEMLTLNDQRIAATLDGLPEEKMHCSNIAASALHAAVQQYWATVAGEVQPVGMQHHQVHFFGLVGDDFNSNFLCIFELFCSY